jgi:hypothetical protein
MKAKWLAILLTLVLSTGVTLADTESSSQANVFVEVVENVATGVITPLVNLGEVQTGLFGGQIIFRVDANVQIVHLQVAVSNLYKDDVPDSIWQIPVALNAGVVVVNQDQVREQPSGADNVMPFVGGTAVGPYGNGLITAPTPFSAGQNGHFSQDVVVQCTWDQIDPELPRGEYSGLVIFTALIL